MDILSAMFHIGEAQQIAGSSPLPTHTLQHPPLLHVVPSSPESWVTAGHVLAMPGLKQDFMCRMASSGKTGGIILLQKDSKQWQRGWTSTCHFLCPHQKHRISTSCSKFYR